ncbi:MAG TPA: single-stranded DNA-binding protein [Pseudobdellovibrionaceae bacterium]|nr:single-stranded DNA-binding protein [Pseudobdellovibrionaceae bacterium]
MGSINRVTLMGSLGSSPERRQTAQGKHYVRLSLATQRRHRHPQTGAVTSQTQWHAINVWGKDADLCLQYLGKGSPVCIEGHLSPYKREVNGPGSELRTHIAIVADRVQLIPGTRAAQMAEPTHLLDEAEPTNTEFDDSASDEAAGDLESDLAKSEMNGRALSRLEAQEETKAGRLKRTSASKASSQVWPN